ncbi:MAG: hypothetical protein ACOY4W_12005 [Thermodesulfobacteriota bacterium]
MLKAYEVAAKTIYVHSPNKLTQKTLFNDICKSLKLQLEALENDRAISSLLRFKKDYGNEFEKINLVISFTHESIYEFFIASLIVKSLVEECSDFLIISNFISRTTNKIVRDIIFNDYKNQLKNIAQKLYNHYIQLNYKNCKNLSLLRKMFCIYNSLINAQKIEKNKEIIIRHNICYFLGRIEEAENYGYISQIFSGLYNNDIIDHEVVKTTVGSSTVFLNDKEYEKKYIQQISNNGPIDICNRVYHLVYYGDISIDKPDSFIKWIQVDCWVKTRNSIIKRLRSNKKRHQELRSLDLVTFRKLYTQCKPIILNSIEIETINNCCKSLILSNDKLLIVQNEHKKLLDSL